MRFYHWTQAERARKIKGEGFKRCEHEYDSVGDGIFGVWASEQRDTPWRIGNDALIVLDIPDDLLDSSWKVTEPSAVIADVDDWRLPQELATQHICWPESLVPT